MFIVKRYASDKSREKQIEEALFQFLYPNRFTAESKETLLEPCRILPEKMPQKKLKTPFQRKPP